MDDRRPNIRDDSREAGDREPNDSCACTLEQRRRHWWNGKWDKLARRDVLLYLDDKTNRWSVEAREGGADGDSRWWELVCEPDAMKVVEALTEPDEFDQWRELPVRSPLGRRPVGAYVRNGD